jgi:hypothetical protein
MRIYCIDKINSCGFIFVEQIANIERGGNCMEQYVKPELEILEIGGV